MRLTKNDKAIMQTMWGEARGESDRGKIAVACVILNRVEEKSWMGKDPFEVCHQKWQFSCWNKNDPNCDKIKKLPKEVYVNYMPLLKQAKKEDITNGALHYKVKGHKASWHSGEKPCAVFGNHEFFNNIK